MKRMAVGFVLAAAILTGSAAAQAHTVTVSEACGWCVMPDGTEHYSTYEVLVETYFVIASAPGLDGLVRRIVTRETPGSSTTILIDQIVIEGHAGPGPIVMIIAVGDGGSVAHLYQWRDQEIIELLSLLVYGKKGWWW